MKTAILIFLSLAFSQARAAEYFKNRRMTKKEAQAFVAKLTPSKPLAPPAVNKPANPGNPNPAPLVPIREGKFKAEIFKLEVHKNPDDSYTMSSTPVCITENKAPIYDGRGIVEWIVSNPYFSTCATTVEGRPATVGTGSYMMLQSGNWFSNEPDSDFKRGSFQMNVMEGSNMVQINYDATYARDLSAQSMLGGVGATGISVCRPTNDGTGDIICEMLTGEFFFARYELLD